MRPLPSQKFWECNAITARTNYQHGQSAILQVVDDFGPEFLYFVAVLVSMKGAVNREMRSDFQKQIIPPLSFRSPNVS